MSSGPRLFKVYPSEKSAQRVSEIDFAQLGLRERRDIQEWIAATPSILGDDLLIIAKEFSGFDGTNERADLVAVDQDGNVVVIELKRDDTGADVHWQAIKYASYFQRATADDIVGMLAAYAKVSEDEAVTLLTSHIDADDLSDLNRDQRIILASHRFAPEVTSAVVWLNQKTGAGDLISCIELVPYRDAESDSVYMQVSTILPIPGVEEVIVGPGSVRSVGPSGVRSDEVTRFLRGAASTAIDALSDELRPDKRSRWAGVGPVNRYYQLWYSTPPWGSQVMRYQLLLPKETRVAPFKVTILMRCDKEEQVKRHQDSDVWFSDNDLVTLKDRLAAPEVATNERTLRDDDRWLILSESRSGDALDGPFQGTVADMVRGFVESVTPIVQDIAKAESEE
ncbi:MAG: endonuclease NucS [Chloroflexi bacterium]|nr:endonuclease NucS [Chloroflexota bacterium]